MDEHCLFLEGSSFVGKSGLIIKNLLPYQPLIGGFLVQRMTEADELHGFCLQEITGMLPSLTVPYNIRKNNIFVDCTEGCIKTHPEVFTKAGVSCLEESRLCGKRIVLLDEIGGIELLQRQFIEALYQVLGGDIPCIGVLKSTGNRKKMEKHLSIGNELTEVHRQLREDITNRFGGKILFMTSENISAVETELQAFLHKNVGL